MKIVVLTGSPRKNGNSAYLAEQFIKGAEEKGHEVFRFDCASPSAPDRRGYGGVRHADVLLRHLGIDETCDRPLLCHQRTDKGRTEESRLPDDLR